MPYPLAPKSMLCAYATSSTAPRGSQKSSRLTHGMYVLSVRGWNVVMAAERLAGSSAVGR